MKWRGGKQKTEEGEAVGGRRIKSHCCLCLSLTAWLSLSPLLCVAAAAGVTRGERPGLLSLLLAARPPDGKTAEEKIEKERRGRAHMEEW